MTDLACVLGGLAKISRTRPLRRTRFLLINQALTCLFYLFYVFWGRVWFCAILQDVSLAQLVRKKVIAAPPISSKTVEHGTHSIFYLYLITFCRGRATKAKTKSLQIEPLPRSKSKVEQNKKISTVEQNSIDCLTKETSPSPLTYKSSYVILESGWRTSFHRPYLASHGHVGFVTVSRSTSCS